MDPRLHAVASGSRLLGVLSAPLRYRDFPIEITNESAKARVRVLGTVPGGDMRDADAEVVAVDLDALEPGLRKVWRRRLDVAGLTDIGVRLGEVLLPGRVRELFERSRAALTDGEGLRVRLSVESDALAALPWELAHAPRSGGEPVVNDFLVLQRAVSFVRQQATGDPPRDLAPQSAFRVLVSLAEPDDQPPLNLSVDEAAITAAIAEADDGQSVITSHVVEPATRASLLREIAGADVLHFGGHGFFTEIGFADDGTAQSRGGIVLEDDSGASDRLDSAQLAGVLAAGQARLVVLGACQTAQRDARGTWSGVAPALVREGVPAVVAMQFGVLDASARPFLSALYRSLFTGFTIDEAVALGRRAVFVEGRPEDRDWATPVLYLRDGDGVLFPLPTEGPATAILRLRQAAETVRGRVIGMEGAPPPGVGADIQQTIGTVEETGEVVAAKFGGEPRRQGGGDG